MGGNLSANEEKKILSLENLVNCKRKKYPSDASSYEDSLGAINLLKNKIESINNIKIFFHFWWCVPPLLEKVQIFKGKWRPQVDDFRTPCLNY